MDLTDDEARALLDMAKIAVDATEHGYPYAGQIHIPLVSRDGRESFFLDIERSGVKLTKGKYQTRARGAIPLARLDFNGAPHRNPDGEEIACPHLHVYREGYGERWAYPLPGDIFGSSEDRWQLLVDFMRFCNIQEAPNIMPSLFV